MGIVPDYKSGTASVTAGQRAVTGTGTAWQVSPTEPVVRPGDLFGRAGLWVPIESVTDNTHLTLAEDWSGATLTNSAYSIRFQPDGSRYTAAARTLVEMLSNGILSSLSGLAAAADKLPFFTGANAFGLTTLTAFARSLLDDVDQATARVTLGAQADLGYTPVNKAGDTMSGSLWLDVPHIINQQQFLAVGSRYQGNFSGVGWQYAIDGSGTSSSYITTWANGVPYQNAQFFSGASRFNGNVEVIAEHAVNKSAKVRLGSLYQGNFFGISASYIIDASGTPGRYIVYIENDVEHYVLKIDTSLTTFYNNVAVNGTLSKGSGTFLIDHPLDPANKDLLHGFVEAPRYDLIYRGKVRLVAGRATVDIDLDSNPDHPMTPGTFATLTINATVHVLQNLEGFARLRPGPIAGATFEIICEDDTCADEVAWMVIAERNDQFVRSTLDPNTDENGRFMPEREKKG